MPSQLAPPTLSWVQLGKHPLPCDLCPAIIPAHGDAFVCVRRCFELQANRMVEVAPLSILMCVDCGWSRPYAPTPRPNHQKAGEAPKVDPAPSSPTGGASTNQPEES